MRKVVGWLATSPALLLPSAQMANGSIHNRENPASKMNPMPQDREEWERFWLVALGTTVLGLAFFFARIGSAWRVESLCGQWPSVVFLLSTAALGIYSVHLLLRGRILLGTIGLFIFSVGTLWNLPTLGR